jgi:elongation factor G
MSEALKAQRTYALVGHGGCGKTSLAEMLLFNAGAIARLGKIEEGTTALDYEPEEIKRRGSIQPGFAQFKWNKNQHFLIDTPGDSNFNGDLSYQLAAADGVVFVIDAVDGVKPLTRKAWKDVQAARLPAVVCINKMDRDRADFQTAFDGLKNALGIKPVLLYYPIGARETFKGVVDMLENKALLFDGKGGVTKADVPGDVASEVGPIREAMIENIAESDEALMEKYLEEGALSPDEIKTALKAGVLSRELVPVCVSAALQKLGGAQLLPAALALLPSPLDHAPWAG